MKLITNTCYSHIIYMQQQPALWNEAIHKAHIGKPDFNAEGIAGYIQTDIEFEIANIEAFSKLWMSWYTEETTERNQLYHKLITSYNRHYGHV